MKKETKQGSIAALKHFGVPYTTALLTPFLAIHPEWMLLWYSAIGLFSVYMEYNQDKVNDFVKLIEANPEVFVKEIVKTEEFKEGFLITFQEFIKTRGEKKREAVKRIFLGFTEAKDKTSFELERMYDCLSKLSIGHFDLLADLSEERGGICVMDYDAGWGKASYHEKYDDFQYLRSLGILGTRTDIEMEQKKKNRWEPRQYNSPSYAMLSSLEEEDDLPIFKQEEFMHISDFGKNFIEFIKTK